MASSRVLFITGTDTGVGKTVLTVLLIRHLRRRGLQALALKPVASGGRDDARALFEAMDRKVPLDQINPWHFRAALAPPLAARRQARRLEVSSVLRHLRACRGLVRWLVVEGAGGLLSPLGEDFDSRTLIRALGATPIVVAANRLGAVHQVRAALSALPEGARRRAITVLSGVAHPGEAAGGNADLLREFQPHIDLITLPYSPQWRDASLRPSRGVTKALGELLRLAGVSEDRAEP